MGDPVDTITISNIACLKNYHETEMDVFTKVMKTIQNHTLRSTHLMPTQFENAPFKENYFYGLKKDRRLWMAHNTQNISKNL